MKRKVIKHGPSTFIVSLPSKWVKEHAIIKGDEVTVSEEGDRIVISTSREKTMDPISLHVQNYSANTVHRAISAAYKIGYDAMTVYVSTPEERRAATNTINSQCIGFEVVDEGKDFVAAKQITHADEKMFKDMLRRTFLMLLGMADDCQTAMKTSNKNMLLDIALRDAQINKLTGFCRRYINKRGNDSSEGHPTTTYYIVESLEKVGDCFKHIGNYLHETTYKPTQRMEDIHTQINIMLRKAYELYYQFDKTKYGEFIEFKKAFDKLLFEQLVKATPVEQRVLLHLYNASELVFDLNGPIFANAL